MDPRAASLEGRTAAVTGAGAGIGRGIARVFAAFGARVALLERNAESAAATAAAIAGAGGTALALPTDVRDADAFDRALGEVERQLGPLEILVNNAGGVFAAPFLESTPKGWHALLRANLDTVLHGTQLAARRMVSAGVTGSIINVASIEAVRAAPLYAAYAAAKAGVLAITRTTAVELAPHGIRVNALAPDICVTEGLSALVPEDERARWPLVVPLGRAAEPEDVAGAAVFLASDLSRYVTGIVLHVDGGTYAASGWWRDPTDGGWSLGPPRRR